MRCLPFLLMPTLMLTLIIGSATTLAAPDDLKGLKDLRPRYGNGWTGCGVGTTVRMKMTATRPGRVPFVQITTTTLKKIEKTKLTMEQLIENQLTDPRKQAVTVPPAGDAAFDEKQTIRKLENETINAGGRSWTCTRREITITGPKGKRIITEWISVSPLIRVKRLEKNFDAKGKSTGMTSTMLTKAPKVIKVGSKKLLCVGYKSISKNGDVEQRSENWSSRQMPGDFVSGEYRIYRKGKLTQTFVLKVLRFQVKSALQVK